jgi:hypothetical protein
VNEPEVLVDTQTVTLITFKSFNYHSVYTQKPYHLLTFSLLYCTSPAFRSHVIPQSVFGNFRFFFGLLTFSLLYCTSPAFRSHVIPQSVFGNFLFFFWLPNVELCSGECEEKRSSAFFIWCIAYTRYVEVDCRLIF